MITPARQPQQEYIITEEQVETIHHLFSIPEHAMDDADYMMQEDILAVIRSRSHTSPPAPAFTPHIPGKENSNTYRCCEVCPNVLSKPVFRCNCLQPEHDAAIRKAERERFRKMILDMREDGIIPSKTWALLFEGIGKLAKESLRAQQQGGVSE